MSAFDPRVTRWIAWTAPFAVLAILIGVETGWGSEWRRDLPSDAPAAPAAVEVPVMPEYRIEGGVEAMRATLDRPLFVATRRPAPTLATADSAKPAIQRGQFVLTGTMIVDNVAVAFLRESGGAGKSRTVRKGEAIAGMRVASVEPDRVTLTLGDDSEELELKVQRGPKTTVQAPEGQPAPPQAAQPAGGAQVQPAAAAARPRGQGTTGPPGSTAEQNLRQNRRTARTVEAQSRTAQGAAAPAPADPAQPPPTPGSWDNVYRNMQRRQP